MTNDWVAIPNYFHCDIFPGLASLAVICSFFKYSCHVFCRWIWSRIFISRVLNLIEVLVSFLILNVAGRYLYTTYWFSYMKLSCTNYYMCTFHLPYCMYYNCMLSCQYQVTQFLSFILKFDQQKISLKLENLLHTIEVYSHFRLYTLIPVFLLCIWYPSCTLYMYPVCPMCISYMYMCAIFVCI